MMGDGGLCGAFNTARIRRNQTSNRTQSDAIRRNHHARSIVFSVFSCFGRAARACVFCFCVLVVFWAGTQPGLPVILCFRVLADTPPKTQGGGRSCTEA